LIIDDAAWDDFNDHGDVDDDSDEEGDECLLHSDAVHVKALLTTGATFGEDEDSIDEEGVNCSELPLSWTDTCRQLKGHLLDGIRHSPVRNGHLTLSMIRRIPHQMRKTLTIQLTEIFFLFVPSMIQQQRRMVVGNISITSLLQAP
jgi:hypothetical protein